MRMASTFYHRFPVGRNGIRMRFSSAFKANELKDDGIEFACDQRWMIRF